MNNDLTMIVDLLNQMADENHSAEIAFSTDPKREMKGVQARVTIKREGSTFHKSLVFTGDNDNLGMAYHLKEMVQECNKIAKA